MREEVRYDETHHLVGYGSPYYSGRKRLWWRRWRRAATTQGAPTSLLLPRPAPGGVPHRVVQACPNVHRRRGLGARTSGGGRFSDTAPTEKADAVQVR